MNEIKNRIESKGYNAREVLKGLDKEDRKTASKKKLKGDKKLVEK